MTTVNVTRNAAGDQVLITAQVDIKPEARAPELEAYVSRISMADFKAVVARDLQELVDLRLPAEEAKS